MTSTPTSRTDVEAWTQRHFGLTLDNYPSNRGDQLTELLAKHAPSSWDGLTDEAAAILSIPETHFLRHPECFVALRTLLENVARARPVGRVRLWSAGCASGEEAYNLAALGLEVVGERVEVFATDFSQDAVDRAHEGVYGSWSLRGVDLAKVPWLRTRDDGRVQVADHVKAKVTFICGTLAEPGPPLDIDVAFCRNVLIYFCDEGSGRVLRRIATALRPDGHLIMAPTDPVPTELARWTQIQIPAPRPVRVYEPPVDTVREATPPLAPVAEPDAVDIAASIRELLRKP